MIIIASTLLIIHLHLLSNISVNTKCKTQFEIYAHLCCVMLQLIYVTKHYSTILIASQYRSTVPTSNQQCYSTSVKRLYILSGNL